MRHSANCKRVFSRYDPDCPRCRELSAGAAPRTGWGNRRKQQEAEQLRAIRAHSCAQAGCGPVCTFGDW